jgi:hypothetical protein
MIKLLDILKEDDVEDTFGKVIFGSDKEYARIQGKDVERNTKAETELIQAIANWVEGSYPSEVSKILWRKYDVLKKASSVFPQILKPRTTNGTDLYRGVSSLNVELKSKLLKTKPSDWMEDGGKWRYTKPVVYKPHQVIQSWTSNQEVAWGFSIEVGTVFGGMLTTKQNDEFLFNQDFISLVYSRESNSKVDEEEVLHFGKTFTDDVYIIVTAPMFKEIKDAYFMGVST